VCCTQCTAAWAARMCIYQAIGYKVCAYVSVFLFLASCQLYLSNCHQRSEGRRSWLLWRITSPSGSALQAETTACHDHEGLKLALEWAVSLQLAQSGKWQMPRPFINTTICHRMKGHGIHTFTNRDKGLHEPKSGLYCEYHFQVIFGAGFWHDQLKAPRHTVVQIQISQSM
jgi:hypothetical protein